MRKKNIAIATFGRYKKRTPSKNTGFVINLSNMLAPKSEHVVAYRIRFYLSRQWYRHWPVLRQFHFLPLVLKSTFRW